MREWLAPLLGPEDQETGTSEGRRRDAWLLILWTEPGGEGEGGEDDGLRPGRASTRGGQADGHLGSCYFASMQTFTAIVERDAETGLLVGHVPGWPGAHSQGATLDELHENLREVVSMLLEDGG